MTQETNKDDAQAYAYLLMRTDLDSLGMGKSRAQAMHVGNQMTWRLCVEPLVAGRSIGKDVEAWHREGDGFGTAIAIGGPGQVDKAMLEKVVAQVLEMGMSADTVIDETYPYVVSTEIHDLIAPEVHTRPADRIRDGWRCYRREVTAAWIFGDKAKLELVLDRFSLTPDQSWTS